jgi:putative PIN family toxin of toxin-antitoxin system
LIIVVDSGVWISALQFEGTPLLVFERILAHGRIAICELIVHEIQKALKRKFGWSEEEIEEALAFYAGRAIQVEVQGEVCGFCRDPKDDMVLECAVLAGAEIIVTGDKDLLIMGLFRGIRILSPREFLQLPESPVP